MCDDLQAERAELHREWMDDHIAGTERLIFRLLLIKLAELVPGFSLDGFAAEVRHTVLAAPRLSKQNVVTEWMHARSKEIIDEMLP